jgi:hypothetical protein
VGNAAETAYAAIQMGPPGSVRFTYTYDSPAGEIWDKFVANHEGSIDGQLKSTLTGNHVRVGSQELHGFVVSSSYTMPAGTANYCSKLKVGSQFVDNQSGAISGQVVTWCLEFCWDPGPPI